MNAATAPAALATRPRVAVLQSNYIPWKGYFDIVNAVDVFVFYDDLQFTKNDWRNRNRIKTEKGLEWLSIPVGQDQHRLICEVELKDAAWQARHWATLKQNYGKCPHFGRYRPFLEDLYLGRRWQNLSELNQHLISHIAREWLGCTTTFDDSRRYALGGQKLDRLLDLIGQTGAASYLSGPAARDYIEPERLSAMGVELRWQDYAGYPIHPQRFGAFEHAVTVLDLLFNTGADAAWYIWGWRDGPLT